MSCPKCGGAGWLWWYELDNYDGLASELYDCYGDDTKYLCDHPCHQEEGIVSAEDRLKSAITQALKEGSLRNPSNLVSEVLIEFGLVDCIWKELPDERELKDLHRFLTKEPYKDHELLELAKRHLVPLLEDQLALVRLATVVMKWDAGIATFELLQSAVAEFKRDRQARLGK